MEVKTRKKLIEVSLPLDAINTASAREKSIRHGHPSTLHLWWARRPLAAARAVIFSQMVDDPSSVPEEFPTTKDQEKERKRLFKIIEDLVLWENTTNETVINTARKEIKRSWERACKDNKDYPKAAELFDPDNLPAFHDPFAGGGALPLEAQRLGLEAYASDLNPVAVMLNKAMIEIPPKFAGCDPVNPEWQQKTKEEKMGRKWIRSQGLADDVRYYGQWMRDEAEKRIGHLYPKVKITTDMIKERPDLEPYQNCELTVIAWLWARTVKSPNPAFSNVDVPLVSNFVLSTKSGNEAYIEPIIVNSSYTFNVKIGLPKNLEITKRGTKAGTSGSSFLCLISGAPMSFEYLRSEAKAGRMGERLLAVVVEGNHKRIYLSPSDDIESIAVKVKSLDVPNSDLPPKALGFRVQEYGINKWKDLFTKRQLFALNTFSDLVGEARENISIHAGLVINKNKANMTGNETKVQLYADSVCVYLAFGVDKCADYWSSICSWHNSGEKIRNTFGRHAIPMVWDYAEANPFCSSSGNWMSMINWTWKAVNTVPAEGNGVAYQYDAQTQSFSKNKVISTDPPYYDNIGYADLSDFFYVWMRLSLRDVYPDLFSTVTVPKNEELIATPYRHESRKQAESFFLEGMTLAMNQISSQSNTVFPDTIYYAFKQSETNKKDGISSTGWETFLEAVIRAGFAISGTWPIRTELKNRIIGSGTNALANSIVIVCRCQNKHTSLATRREFINVLKVELPRAISNLQASNIAPVDLAQSAIGPGMAIYTRYNRILDSTGNQVTVRDALILINQILDETLADQEGEFDNETRWALAWYEQLGFSEGEFGIAETLSKAKIVSVEGLKNAGVITSSRGRVRLLAPSELATNWDPLTDSRLTEWEIVHHLIRLLEIGETEAAEVIAKLGSVAEIARELAYRLYHLAERKNRSQEALQYNTLVQSWPELIRLAEEIRKTTPVQSDLFED